jgi:single-strand DNA-binding protein
MASDTNSVVLVGRLTKDPETRSVGSGTVTELRLAVTSSRKVGESWEDQPNYFSVAVFGRQGEAAARYLAKGSQVAVNGRLAWREWQDKSGGKRESVSIVASSVQFVGAKSQENGSVSPATQAPAAPAAPVEDIPF